MIERDPDLCFDIFRKSFEKRQEAGARILQDYKIKKILNDFFNPDEYLFFCEDSDIFPVVVKKSTAYFFGGDLPFNEFNSLPDNKDLLNKSIDYLVNAGLDFRFTSIVCDQYDNLRSDNAIYDVPYNQEWIVPDIGNFNIDTFISNCKKKKRDKLKRASKLSENILVETVSPDVYFGQYHNKIYELYINSFSQRGLVNCWFDKKDLYDRVVKWSLDNYKTVNRVFKKDSEILASYTLIFRDREIFLSFSNCYNFEIENLQLFIYMDILKTSSGVSCEKSFLSAGRGSFGYKRRMGFSPVPMYSLVNDPDWKKDYNSDISREETLSLYGRDFGCFI